MKVIVSIHDVSPYFQKEIEIILRKFEGINKSFLITPLWNESNHFSKDFASTIKNEDLVLHGLTHQTEKTDLFGKIALMSSRSLKEFYGLNKIETKLKIITAITIFEDTFFKTPTGFIPPMWYHNKYTLEILKELEFHYTETSFEFINLQTNKRTFSIPVCFDFGKNNLLNNLSVKGWKYIFKNLKQPLIRLSIHPADIENGFCNDISELIKWLIDKNYTFLTYKQLN